MRPTWRGGYPDEGLSSLLLQGGCGERTARDDEGLNNPLVISSNDALPNSDLAVTPYRIRSFTNVGPCQALGKFGEAEVVRLSIDQFTLRTLVPLTLRLLWSKPASIMIMIFGLDLV